MIVDLRATTDKHNLLVGLKDEETLKKTTEKKSIKKVVEVVTVVRAIILKVR